MTNTLTLLQALGACTEALDWVRAQSDQSPEALWSTCPRADWLLWVLSKDQTELYTHIVRASYLASCARLDRVPRNTYWLTDALRSLSLRRLNDPTEAVHQLADLREVVPRITPILDRITYQRGIKL